jgi:hypothetical protein
MKAHRSCVALFFSLATILGVASGETPLPAPKVPFGVPPDAEFFNGKWYRVYLEKCRWTTARDKCTKLRGRLVTVPDLETHEFIKKLANGRALWLGATETRDKGWVWVDGTPMTFTSWDKGEPNNHKTKHEDFLQIRPLGDWNDAPNDCPDVSGYVCEWINK